MNNHLAKCISKQCENYNKCIRAISKNNAHIDYIKINEEHCDWYMEVQNEIENTGSDIDVGSKEEEDGNKVNI